eukprot:TRINITY_DN4378_c0_g1_i6.p2 TRINITY_DN4378_c0_g1~~TRINITY_DN4378_c0_g1_i6.p2  ORF type:complete len:166 (-),score=51.46 TRINITY_DN4378_c0_g1_i6:927-1424(-)
MQQIADMMLGALPLKHAATTTKMHYIPSEDMVIITKVFALGSDSERVAKPLTKRKTQQYEVYRDSPRHGSTSGAWTPPASHGSPYNTNPKRNRSSSVANTSSSSSSSSMSKSSSFSNLTGFSTSNSLMGIPLPNEFHSEDYSTSNHDSLDYEFGSSSSSSSSSSK